MADERLTATVSGRVQGVGFRYWTRGQAELLGLDGLAENRPDGTVRITAEGPRQSLERLVSLLESEAPGRVDRVDASFAEATGRFRDFGVG
ncbi:acylphosphatase [Arthrobacter sp. I2-34]|uniref:acylphosphatase n=1 Tax=Arthrobacter hankyongi TaxID=2904801 RepID=A0ABS9LE16_9MICC|nr:acylphosphatase [Arthrobacter hankyongi]MCG2624868.1 acylphosphatase [Arthrobacter hankyongi]